MHDIIHYVAYVGVWPMSLSHGNVAHPMHFSPLRHSLACAPGIFTVPAYRK